MASSAPAAASSPAAAASEDPTAAGIAWATDLVAQYGTRPTTIPVTTPVSKAIPEGKTVFFINCGAAACILEADILKQATDTLGWNLKVINTDGSPAQMKDAWQQAVDLKPDGLIYTAIPESVFKDLLPQVQANGTATAACCVPYSAEQSGIDFIVDGAADNALQGEIQAAWMIQDSAGTGKTAYVNLPSYEILSILSDGFSKAIAEHCPACTEERIDVDLTEFADKDKKIVSYLLANPDVKYVAVSVDDLAIGLPAALAAAGLTDIKIIGDGANTTTLDYIRDGSIAADVAFPYYNVVYSMLDGVVRKVIGDPITQEPPPGLWVMTADNLPEGEGIVPEVADYQAQWDKIWLKS